MQTTVQMSKQRSPSLNHVLKTKNKPSQKTELGTWFHAPKAFNKQKPNNRRIDEQQQTWEFQKEEHQLKRILHASAPSRLTTQKGTSNYNPQSSIATK